MPDDVSATITRLLETYLWETPLPGGDRAEVDLIDDLGIDSLQIVTIVSAAAGELDVEPDYAAISLKRIRTLGGLIGYFDEVVADGR